MCCWHRPRTYKVQICYHGFFWPLDKVSERMSCEESKKIWVHLQICLIDIDDKVKIFWEGHKNWSYGWLVPRDYGCIVPAILIKFCYHYCASMGAKTYQAPVVSKSWPIFHFFWNYLVVEDVTNFFGLLRISVLYDGILPKDKSRDFIPIILILIFLIFFLQIMIKLIFNSFHRFLTHM